jgi:hypothetical protein
VAKLKPVEEIVADPFVTQVYTLVMPTNTARTFMCGCLVEGSICQGGQLYSTIMLFRKAGVDIRVYPYLPECYVEYDGPNVYLYKGARPEPELTPVEVVPIAKKGTWKKTAKKARKPK